MKNFVRALRFAFPYRARIIVSVICAVLAALFWSLNFTAIYPTMKIVGSGKNLQELIDDSIADVQKRSDEVRAGLEDKLKEQKRLLTEPPDADRFNQERHIARDIAVAESKLKSAAHEDARYRHAKRYIDAYLPTDRFRTIAFLVGLVVIGMALKGIFEFFQETLVGSVVNLSLFGLRNMCFRKVVHLDVSHFNEQGTHEMMSRFTNDIEMLGNGQKMLFGKMIAEPLRALGCVVFACFISWQLTFMFLVLVPVALVILTRVGRMMKRATRRMLERMSLIYKILQESFTGIRVVKAFTREAGERARFRRATREYYTKAMWVVKLDAIAGPIIEVLGIAAVAGALLAGAYLVINKKTHFLGIQMAYYPLEAESLLQLYALLAAISDPVRKLSSFLTKVQSGAAAADRIFNLIDRDPKVQSQPQGPRLNRHAETIEFKNVCFSYDPGHPILNGIDLRVRFGETIALVGKNGSGKSTLMNLLPRFYDPDHGSITVDGIDIRMANLRTLRQQVGVVTQDTILFDDTIARNISYGHPHATAEEIESAARQAFAHDFIAKLPNGYETRVGEAGSKLSGGQKQRLTLARAILRNPSILILDEFTSQSDAESEAIVHKFLREFMRQRTTFVITHRLNTLEIADRIVVLDAGRIVAVGTHADLLDHCNVYQRLHEAHFQRRVA
ncbi:MAG: ABC transporter ATP-binding protein [Planctomycetes bacterium]|nr:ABC transporter ATP-binding protein [Planctomycetota bacterium]